MPRVCSIDDQKSDLLCVSEMSESDLLSNEQLDGLDGLENGQDGDALMHNDCVRRDFTEANIDDPVSSNNVFL